MAGSGMSYSINLTEWEYEKDEASEDLILGKLMQFARHSKILRTIARSMVGQRLF